MQNNRYKKAKEINPPYMQSSKAIFFQVSFRLPHQENNPATLMVNGDKKVCPKWKHKLKNTNKIFVFF